MQQETEVQLSKQAKKRLAAQAHNEAMAKLPAEVRSPTLEEREELEALSKEVFGSTSRYATILRDGEVKAVTVVVTEYIPADEGTGGEGTTKETEVVDTLPGAPKSAKLQLVRHSVESIRALMVDRKARQDLFRALQKKQHEEALAKQALAQRKQEVQRQLSGSAI